MVTREHAQELYESAIALVQHDGYFVPDVLNRTLQFNRRYNAYGVCNGKVTSITRKLVSADISISKYFIDNEGATENQVFNVLVHEVLHACFPGEGHKGGWKAAAERISSLHSNLEITRCASFTDANNKNVLPNAPKRQAHITYIMSCSECGKAWKWHRANKYTKHGALCPVCGNKLNLVVNHD